MLYYKIIEGKQVFSDCKTVQMEDGTWISNPSAEQIAAAGWIEYVHVRTLEEAKQEKVAEIDAYDKSDDILTFSLGGVAMWLNPQQRTNFLMTVNAAEEYGMTSVPFGGSQIPIGNARSILNAVALYAMQTLAVTDSHKAAVMALDTIEAVDAYNYHTGYPQTLSF